MWFLSEAHFEILRSPLRSWNQNESVGGIIFWFQIPDGSVHKMRQQSNWQFTNCLEKCDFEQTTPNMGILYTIGNDFSPRLTIWSSYLKIKPRLTGSTVKVLSIRLRKRVLKSGHFFCKPRVPLRSWDQKEPYGAKNHCQRWPEIVVGYCSTAASHA